MYETPKSRRRKFQYSLRSLCLVMLLACIVMSWVGGKMQQARRQKQAVDAIENLGGKVTWRSLVILSRVDEDDFFAHVDYVNFAGSPVTDAGLENIKILDQLHSLNLGGTQITDVGLENLKGLNHLKKLLLFETQVTDAGLEPLKGLYQLEWISLNGTKVTDAGLEKLKGLNQLELLDLSRTKVTDEGVTKLKQALPNCQINH